MPTEFTYRILVVDDEEDCLRETSQALTSEGYLVHTAHDGFEALAKLRGGQPEILISDLKMPNMSGFELLSVVRKRFPAMGVIAHTDRFIPLSSLEGVLADRFLSKGPQSTRQLLPLVRELLTHSPVRAQDAKGKGTPVSLPVSATGYVVITCPTCLRSFSLSSEDVELGVTLNDSCVHCGAEVQYQIDPSVAERLRKQIDETHRRIATSRVSLASSKRRISQSQ
jgi:CheY-like chemotaxis protein